MRSLSFYHHHLEKVSRSFSFCIIQLKPPAREWVALSYLLCRIADTIEDSDWRDPALQNWTFRTYKAFLQDTFARGQAARSEDLKGQKPLADMISNNDFHQWLHCFPDSTPLAEKNLLLDLPHLLDNICQLPREIQKQLQTTLFQMIDGMMYFLNTHKESHKFSLPSLKATNQYCFFVAGITGELLTYLYSYLIPEFQLTNSLLNQALHFGLFLQKINILKDQKNDELAGRYYISSRSDLRNSLIANAKHAISYLQTIPVSKGREYRLFCAWSLFMGLASLKWIDKKWHTNSNDALGYRETSYLLNQIRAIIDDNHALDILFRRYVTNENIVILQTQPIITKIPPWFSAIYPDTSRINGNELGISE